MSKSYFNYIQPTIVRLSDDPELPENLRNHYMININIVGIPYFVDNYLLIEGGNGDYMYMLTNDYHKIRLSDDGMENVIDIPRAYIVITEDFVRSQDDFSSWVLTAITDNSYYITGTEKFKAGVDFYINDVLAKYLREEEQGAASLEMAILPDYLNGKFEITKYWQELTPDIARYTNFDFFRLKNKIADLTYSEEELDNLKHTFFKILHDDASVSEEDAMKIYNQIYRSVIEYYYNGETDNALSGISLILNTLINVQNTDTNNCGCSGSADGETVSEQVSCFDAYKQAMAYWLKTMLGDANFYKDWMWIENAEGKYFPNQGLIEELIQLLEDFLAADYNLTFPDKSIYPGSSVNANIYNHTCVVSTDSTLNEARRKIIENYITLLRWVLVGCIDNNKNKIKVIGEKFGELLPMLQF